MNFITVVIIAAISRLTESTIADIYHALKQKLIKTFGQDSALLQSVNALEANPNSKGRQQLLDEELQKAGAEKDSEIKQLAQQIKKALDQHHSGMQGGTTIQNIEGDKNAVAGSFGNATVNIHSNSEK